MYRQATTFLGFWL